MSIDQFIPAWVPAAMRPALNVQSFLDLFGEHPWLEERLTALKSAADKAAESGNMMDPAIMVYQMALMGGASFALGQITAFAPPRKEKSVDDPWANTFTDVFASFCANTFEEALYGQVINWARRALEGRTATSPVPCAGVPAYVGRLVAAYDGATNDIDREAAVNELVFLTAHSFGSHSKLVKTSSGRTFDAVDASGKVLRKSPDGKVFRASLAFGLRASALQPEPKVKAKSVPVPAGAPVDAAPAPTESAELPA